MRLNSVSGLATLRFLVVFLSLGRWVKIGHDCLFPHTIQIHSSHVYIIRFHNTLV
jgi:hypothetical protein